jgi:hypothetical protein
LSQAARPGSETVGPPIFSVPAAVPSVRQSCSPIAALSMAPK